MNDRVGNRIVEAAERSLGQENAMHLIDGFDFAQQADEKSSKLMPKALQDYNLALH